MKALICLLLVLAQGTCASTLARDTFRYTGHQFGDCQPKRDPGFTEEYTAPDLGTGMTAEQFNELFAKPLPVEFASFRWRMAVDNHTSDQIGTGLLIGGGICLAVGAGLL